MTSGATTSGATTSGTIAVAAVDDREAPQAHPAYRPDIDGLRAVAVLSVVGFHAFSWYVPGGFVGVDVFFVISGYLITTIVLGNLRRGDFGYRTFYARRIKRIFPALIVVAASVWVIAWFRLFPDEVRQLGKHLFAGATFSSNFMLRGESGYFDQVAETKPFLHLWSLAIEEQFYIVWPLILAIPFGRRAAMGVIGAIAVASFAFNLLVVDPTPVLAFYSPGSRFWELMLGGLLAQATLARAAWLGRFAQLRSLAGFASIVASIVLFQRGVPYPGWRAAMPTLGAVLIISAGPDAWLNRVALSNRVAVWFGKISYPLYLWHWPLLSFLYIAEGESSSRTMRLVLLLTSVLLAWLTWRLVETPIRTSADARWLPASLFAVLLAMGATGYAAWHGHAPFGRHRSTDAYTDTFDNALPDRRYSSSHGMDAAFREECNFYDLARWREGRATSVPRPAIDPTCTIRPAGTTKAVFLWGDSHAQHLNSGLQAVLPKDVALLQVATSGCAAALVGPMRPDESACIHANRYAFDAIRRERPDVVVVAQRADHEADQLRSIAVALRAAGVRRVVVVGPIPQWWPDLNKVVAAEYWDATPERLATHLAPDIVRTEQRLRRRFGPDEPFTYIDLFAGLCDDSGCRIEVDGDRLDGLMTFDYGHLTSRASSFVARTIIGPPLLRLLDGP